MVRAAASSPPSCTRRPCAHEQREAEAARAVAEERRRIAREMHDVVAHSVSTMVIQAGGARRILARDPQRAIEAAALIERTGREALSEMRHLLGVLHAGEDGAELAPQPTLHELDGLRRSARARAGLPVELHVDGEPRASCRRRRPRRLPHRAGGADQRAQARRRERRGDRLQLRRSTSCACAIADAAARQRAARREQRPRARRHARARARVRRRAARRPAPDGGFGPRVCRCRTRTRRRSPRRRPRPTGGMQAAMTVRIMIADDQALVRAGFKMILDAEDDIEVVGEAVDGLEAVEHGAAADARRRADGHPHARARRHRGDAPRSSPRTATTAPVRVLMLTTFDLNEYVYEALRAGASGFLLKDVPPEQLVAGDPRRRRAARRCWRPRSRAG